jgi:hypothetical protein
MATSRDIPCGICETQHITKYADHWCPECDEGLCAACENHRNILKGTRNHSIISIENLKKIAMIYFRNWLDKSPAQSLWFVEIQSGQHGMSWI